MNTLDEILKGIRIIDRTGDDNPSVVSVTADSRTVSPGSLYIAIKGTRTDGHDYIGQAAAAGCRAVVCEQYPATFHPDVIYVRIQNTQKTLGKIASAFYGHPSKKIKLIGVTGTNGKTTVATLLYRLFSAMGHLCGLLSTVEYRIGNEVYPATHTTPDAVALNKILARMAEAGCTYAFMEVSSHAIDQGRTEGQIFSGGIFTNLTHDHLDYHKTFAAYLKAKKRFFDHLPPSAFALSNADDRNGRIMLQNTKASRHFFGLNSPAEFHVKMIESHFDGMLLNIGSFETWVKLTGRFNASNLAAIFGTSILLGKEAENVLTVLSTLSPAEGRFDTLKSPKGITGIVDYAHTPDALENVLETIRQVNDGRGRIISVVGAGGDRDKSKRPAMAAIAARLSDTTILTSDNPRNENPSDILADMLKGLDFTLSAKTLTIENRREAIRTACTLAQQGDIVLVAGKGHEKYQDIQGIKHPFDDREELRNALQISNA